MAVAEVACPHCNDVVNVTVPSDSEPNKVTQHNSSLNSADVEQDCGECGNRIYIWVQ